MKLQRASYVMTVDMAAEVDASQFGRALQLDLADQFKDFEEVKFTVETVFVDDI